MKNRMATLILVWIALFAVAARAEVFEEYGVGITCDPDSTGEAVPGRGCPNWTTTTNDGFRWYDVGEYDTWIDLDVDFLISWDFDGQEIGEVSQNEAHNFLDALDSEFSNRFGWADTDLGMTFKYAHRSEIPYNRHSPLYHFMIYQDCLDGAPEMTSEINHVDVYMVPSGWAHAPSSYRDTEEDGPAGDPNIWHHNSVSVTDGDGNEIGDPDEEHWPRQSAQQACHEFTHLCWNSNTETYDVQYQEADVMTPHDYNEFFACSAEYLVIPEPGELKWDLYYPYSIVNDIDPGCTDPPASMSEYDRNMNRYALWKLFGAYLGYRFQDPTIENTLLSRWSRNLTDRFYEDRLERTFCGLAKILADDELYGYLGDGPGWNGGWRTSYVFRDYGIARWVDCDSLDAAYYFGPDYSPCRSQGQFRKIDDGAGAYWELAIPAEFILDADHVDQWTEYPDASDPGCPDGWYDYEHGGEYAHLCVPIKADLWGSNYLAFRADTTYFTQSWTDTLVLEFDWTGNMNPYVQLWLSVLTYSASVDSLFLHGNKLDSLYTERYTPYDPETATIKVPDFKKDHTEAVVVVLTVTDRMYAVDHDPTYKCLRRLDYVGEGCTDLPFSYRFKVVGTYDPGGGCPFVSSRMSGGLVTDNNVLAADVIVGDDLLDAYLLRQRPEMLEGSYELRLSEEEADHSRFDRVCLLAVDHRPDVHVAVLPDGSVGPYSISARPVACHDSSGEDVLALVSEADGRTALLEAGTWFEVIYPASSAGRGGGGAGTRGKPGQKIPPPGGGGGRAGPDSDVLDLSELCYRANTCTRILNLPTGADGGGGFLTMRVTAPVDFYVDELFLADLLDDPLAVQTCQLSVAQHSDIGDCLEDVVGDDGVYVDLRPGQTIDLGFSAPVLEPGCERDFVLVTQGRYELGRAEEDSDDQADPELLAAAAQPNPFREMTSIRYEVPEPGGSVAVRIYDASGRVVRTFAGAWREPGPATLVWDGADDRGRRVASGVYFCAIEAAGREAQRRLVLLR